MDFIVIQRGAPDNHRLVPILVGVGGGGTSLGTRLQTIIVEVHHTRGLSENTN